MAESLLAKPPSKILTDYYGTLFSLMVLVFLFAVFFILKPQLDRVKTANAEIVTTAQQLKGEQNYLTSLQQSIDAAQTVAPNVLDRVDQALPRQQRIPELLVLFSNTAHQDGIKLPTISFSDAVAPGGTSVTSSIGEVDITLTATAPSYPQIKKFIRDLEVSLRLLDITGINVSLPTVGEAKEAAYALQMKTYTFAPRSAVPATPQQR